MIGRLLSPTLFWTGALTAGVVANLYLWWPHFRPVLRGDCTDIRAVLLAEETSRQAVRALLGPPTAEFGHHWEYARLCRDAGSGMGVDVAVLFRDDKVVQLVY